MTPGELCRRVWYLLDRSRIERELEEEMAAHREMMADARRASRVDPIVALRADAM